MSFGIGSDTFRNGFKRTQGGQRLRPSGVASLKQAAVSDDGKDDMFVNFVRSPAERPTRFAMRRTTPLAVQAWIGLFLSAAIGQGCVSTLSSERQSKRSTVAVPTRSQASQKADERSWHSVGFCRGFRAA